MTELKTMKDIIETHPSLTNYNQIIGSMIKWYKQQDIQKHTRDVTKIREAIDDCIGKIYTFINIEREDGKVTMEDVNDGLKELKILLLKELEIELKAR